MCDRSTSILTSVVEGNFRKKMKKERGKDTQQGRQRQKRWCTSIEGSGFYNCNTPPEAAKAKSVSMENDVVVSVVVEESQRLS